MKNLAKVKPLVSFLLLTSISALADMAPVNAENSLPAFSAAAASIYPGMRVIDIGDNAGVVVDTFYSSGIPSATVIFDNARPRGASSIRLVTQLTPMVSCYQGTFFCKGNRVTDWNGDTGTIAEISEDGRALIVFDNAVPKRTRSLRHLSTLTAQQPGTVQIQVGGRVINNFREQGTVLAVNKNGHIVVLFDDANPADQVSIVDAQGVSAEVETGFGFYRGQSVVDAPRGAPTGVKGTIKRIYENGIIIVVFNDAYPSGSESYRLSGQIVRL